MVQIATLLALMQMGLSWKEGEEWPADLTCKQGQHAIGQGDSLAQTLEQSSMDLQVINPRACMRKQWPQDSRRDM